MFIGLGHATAAQLKDIRVGEHEGFTRIVFELDSPIATPRIETTASGQLLVAFDNTDADLVRKIPVKRSRHVADVQIWQIKDGLSTVLNFTYAHIRFESFPLSSPPRYAVDVFPADEPAAAASASPVVPRAGEPAEEEPTPQIQVQARELPAEESGESRVQESAQSIIGKTAAKAAEPRAVSETPIPTQLPKRRAQEPDEQEDATTRSEKNASNGLEYYLVVALVLITIVILVLLLMMLLVRHRLSDDDVALKAGKFFEHQEKKIAVLNSRIKEQFRRYEEA